MEGADLTGAELFGADLTEANLRNAKLCDAVLAEVVMSRADLTGADLRSAHIYAANLEEVNLTNAILLDTMIDHSYLGGANLTACQLRLGSMYGVYVDGATMGRCLMLDTDVSEWDGLERVHHTEPSRFSVLTVTESIRHFLNRLEPPEFDYQPDDERMREDKLTDEERDQYLAQLRNVKTFFVAGGVPIEAIEFMANAPAIVEYESCFIAYGEPDVAFATQLREDLVRRGVKCWIYPVDSTPGEDTWRDIEEGRRDADRFLVICSAASLTRDGLQKELERQIDEDPEKLLPLSLDKTWQEPGFKVIRGSADLKPYLSKRNRVDFASLAYDNAFQKLLRAIEKRSG